MQENLSLCIPRSLAAKDYECLVKEYLVAAGVMMDKWTEGREA